MAEFRLSAYDGLSRDDLITKCRNHVLRSMEQTAEIERLRNVITAAADAIEKLAWEIPAPNPVTPGLMQVASSMKVYRTKPSVSEGSSDDG